LRPGIAIVVLGCLAAIPLNRAGYGRTAGVLLVVTVDLALAGTLLTVGGGLDPLYLPAFYLLVTSELIAVSLLPPARVFLLALAHSLCIALDEQVQVHTMMWDQMMTTPGIFYSLIAGPIALQLIVALVSYLWVHSAQLALRRVDRAEEIALWEHRDAERTRELVEGVQQLLAVHVHLANGDFTTRPPAMRDRTLWQVGASLNNLIARLARSAQTTEQMQVTLQRTEQEAQRLAQAISASVPCTVVSQQDTRSGADHPRCQAARRDAPRMPAAKIQTAHMLGRGAAQ